MVILPFGLIIKDFKESACLIKYNTKEIVG